MGLEIRALAHPPIHSLTHADGGGGEMLIQMLVMVARCEMLIQQMLVRASGESRLMEIRCDIKIIYDFPTKIFV